VALPCCFAAESLKLLQKGKERCPENGMKVEAGREEWVVCWGVKGVSQFQLSTPSFT